MIARFVKFGRRQRVKSHSMYHFVMRVLVTLLFLMPLCAQPPQDAPKKGGGGGRAPQNVKVLKLEPGANIGQIMRTYTAGLGVQCTFCHVQGNFASDENPKKEVARHMISMVQEINAKFPDGKEHVACYTCHRGETAPKLAPPAAPPAQ
jgi:photosynthetic reaction center cytochrome c subunit